MCSCFILMLSLIVHVQVHHELKFTLISYLCELSEWGQNLKFLSPLPHQYKAFTYNGGRICFFFFAIEKCAAQEEIMRVGTWKFCFWRLNLQIWSCNLRFICKNIWGRTGTSLEKSSLSSVIIVKFISS